MSDAAPICGLLWPICAALAVRSLIGVFVAAAQVVITGQRLVKWDALLTLRM